MRNREREEMISEVTNGFDSPEKIFDEHEVSHAIDTFIKDRNEKPIPSQWLAEKLAFNFAPQHRHKPTQSDTYYGPMWVRSNQDGTGLEYPDLRSVTTEIITYWAERALKAKHPILKVRYADLVWDLAKPAAGAAPDIEMAQTVIDNTLEIAKQNCQKHEIDIIKKLERALSVAISINDADRIKNVRDIVIQFEDRIEEDDKPGLWGFSFDLLLNNKKIPLSRENQEKIVKDMEDRLARLVNTEFKGYPSAVERAALRLAAHYRALDQKENVKRVVLALGTAFEKSSENASALQASFWLQRMHSLYLEYGLSAEAEKIAVMIKEVGRKAGDEMHSYSSSFKITDEEMENYVNSILDDDFEKSCEKIARHFIIQKNQVEGQLKDMAENAPLSFLVSKQIQDRQGRPLASIGSLENDLIGNVISQASQNMEISAIFLRRAMEAFIARFKLTPQKLIDYLYQSPVFESDKKQIIFDGSQAYFEKNDLAAIHLLVPQIESAFRKLIELSGGSVLKQSRNGGMHLRILDDLLRDEQIISVFGEDASLYFRILLTDQRGWNIRNDVCHGIIPAATFQVHISDRVIHVLLCLGLIRTKEQNEKLAQQDVPPDV